MNRDYGSTKVHNKSLKIHAMNTDKTVMQCQVSVFLVVENDKST